MISITENHLFYIIEPVLLADSNSKRSGSKGEGYLGTQRNSESIKKAEQK